MLYTFNLHSAVCKLYLNKTERKNQLMSHQQAREFLGSSVVRTRASTAGGTDLIPGQGTKILQAVPHAQKNKKTNKKG